MGKIVNLEDLPNDMNIREMMEVKGGSAGDIKCAEGVSAVTCTGSGGVNIQEETEE